VYVPTITDATKKTAWTSSNRTVDKSEVLVSPSTTVGPQQPL
jgi:hypothetical protein